MEGIILIIISYIFSNIAKQKKASYRNVAKSKPARKQKTVERKLGDLLNFLDNYTDEIKTDTETVNVRSISNKSSVGTELWELSNEANIQTETMYAADARKMDDHKSDHYKLNENAKGVAVFKDRETLRKAVIMSEILGKPKSINR